MLFVINFNYLKVGKNTLFIIWKIRYFFFRLVAAIDLREHKNARLCFLFKLNVKYFKNQSK